MREGGYRKVRISPHLAYRGEGVDSKVPANAVLIYELWLTSVDKPSAGARKLVRVLALASLIALLGPAADAFAHGKSVEPSCTAGPYKLKLPKSYKALRGIGTLRRERVQNAGDGKEERELRFNGLEIVVLAQPGKSDYAVQKAIVTAPNWRIAGPLRVGSAARIALKDLKRSALPADGEREFSGDKDSIRVSLARGRVLDFEYSCSAS